MAPTLSLSTAVPQRGGSSKRTSLASVLTTPSSSSEMISLISSAPSFDHSRSSTHSTASGWSVVTPRLDVVGLPTIVSGTNIDEHWENVDDELLGAGQKPWWEQTTPRPPESTDLTRRVSDQRDNDVCLDDSPTLPDELSHTRPHETSTFSATPAARVPPAVRTAEPLLASVRLIRSTSDRPNIFDLSENQRGKLPERDDKMVKSESCGLGLRRLTSATGSGRPHTAGGRPQTAVDAMKNTNATRLPATCDGTSRPLVRQQSRDSDSSTASAPTIPSRSSSRKAPSVAPRASSLKLSTLFTSNPNRHSAVPPAVPSRPSSSRSSKSPTPPPPPTASPRTSGASAIIPLESITELPADTDTGPDGSYVRNLPFRLSRSTSNPELSSRSMTMLWKLCRSSSTSHFKVEASFDTGSLSSFAVPTNRSPGSERESSFLKLEHAKQERSKSRAEERSFLFVEPESEEGKEKTFFLLRRKDGAQSSANTMPESWTRPSAPRSVSDPTVPPTMTGPPPAPVHPSPTKASTMSHHPAAITAPVYRGSLSAHMTPDDWYQEALAALRIAEEWEWPNPPSRSPESMSTSSSEETLGPVTPKSAEMILHGEAEYEEARKRRTTRRFEDL